MSYDSTYLALTIIGLVVPIAMMVACHLIWHFVGVRDWFSIFYPEKRSLWFWMGQACLLAFVFYNTVVLSLGEDIFAIRVQTTLPVGFSGCTQDLADNGYCYNFWIAYSYPLILTWIAIQFTFYYTWKGIYRILYIFTVTISGALALFGSFSGNQGGAITAAAIASVGFAAVIGFHVLSYIAHYVGGKGSKRPVTVDYKSKYGDVPDHDNTVTVSNITGGIMWDFLSWQSLVNACYIVFYILVITAYSISNDLFNYDDILKTSQNVYFWVFATQIFIELVIVLQTWEMKSRESLFVSQINSSVSQMNKGQYNLLQQQKFIQPQQQKFIQPQQHGGFQGVIGATQFQGGYGYGIRK